jgi:hypothetical protein
MIARVSLWCLAVSSAATGVPAAIAPRAFYDGFPLGREWVAMLPPFNQHLVTDVGGFYVAFAVLFAWAAVTLRRELIVPLCTAWTVAALLHFGYHVTHLDGWDVGDAVMQTVVLGLLVVLPVSAMVFAPRRAGLSRRMPAGDV